MPFLHTQFTLSTNTVKSKLLSS